MPQPALRTRLFLSDQELQLLAIFQLNACLQ